MGTENRLRGARLGDWGRGEWIKEYKSSYRTAVGMSSPAQGTESVALWSLRTGPGGCWTTGDHVVNYVSV